MGNYGYCTCFRPPQLRIYGPPSKVRGDVDFSRFDQFMHFVNYYTVKLEDRPASRHNKNGSVEAKHGLTRKLIFRLLADAYASQTKISGPSFDLLSTPS